MGKTFGYADYCGEYLDFNFYDDETTRNIKEALTRIPLAKRKVFIMYCELGSYAEVARRLHLKSPQAVGKIVKAVAGEIRNKLNSN